MLCFLLSETFIQFWEISTSLGLFHCCMSLKQPNWYDRSSIKTTQLVWQVLLLTDRCYVGTISARVSFDKNLLPILNVDIKKFRAIWVLKHWFIELPYENDTCWLVQNIDPMTMTITILPSPNYWVIKLDLFDSLTWLVSGCQPNVFPPFGLGTGISSVPNLFQ